MPARPGAATALVTPGTTSKGIPRALEGKRLFTPSPQHERIAALEAYDPLALTGAPHHQPLDRPLVDRFDTGPLADAEALGMGCQRDDRRSDQCVVQNEIGRLETADRLDRQEVRITKACTDQ